jgi:hypothetical protein
MFYDLILKTAIRRGFIFLSIAAYKAFSHCDFGLNQFEFDNPAKDCNDIGTGKSRGTNFLWVPISYCYN